MVQQADPKIVKAFGPYYRSHQMDIQTGSLWDSISFQPGQTITRGWWEMFTNPITYDCNPPSHPGVRRKTMADTNMTRSRQLDAPESFSINRVVFTFSQSTSDKALYAVAENLTWRLWIGKKRYLWAVIASLPSIHQPIAPLKVCDFCSGIFANSNQCPGCGAREFSLTTLGGEQEKGRQFVLDVDPNLVIDSQTSFYADFEGDPYTLSMDSGFKMWCHLKGLHARGVQ